MKTEDNVVTREELIAQGCTEKMTSNGKTYLENSNGEMVAKECGVCSEVLALVSFYKGSAFGGRGSSCKACISEIMRKKYADNPAKYIEGGRKSRKANSENVRERKRRYREANPEKVRENRRKHRESNRRQYVIREQRRRARKAALPDTLTQEQWEWVVTVFEGGCVLTGSEDYILEHVVPISSGHGGTTIENIVPMCRELNSSKHNANIFEWFNANRVRFGLSQTKFDALISYLAEVNGMTAKEYRMYVDWCFDNPRDIDDLEMEATG